MKQIPLSNSPLRAMVDDEDFARYSHIQWHLVERHGKQYAYGRVNKRRCFLHREIKGAPRGQLVDHENGNGLDCQRHNLRLCTHSQNMGNCKPHSDRAGKYKGVYLEKSTGKYAAQICHQKRAVKIGRFTLAIEAARAYDKKALELFGEFANINLPEEHCKVCRKNITPNNTNLCNDCLSNL